MRQRQLSWFGRRLEAIAKTRFGGWIAIHVANPIDKRLLRWTNGRTGIFVGNPVGILGHVGARSGQPRETPLLYLADGENVILVASKAGSARHPAWYHNLKANPEVTFRQRKGIFPYRAHEAEGAERNELWAKVNDLYVGYDDYQERTGGRVIPVMVLEPRG